jgi:gluconokinase
LTRKLILGLDIGTSSVRAALYDLDANILPGTLVKNDWTLTTTDDGGSEIDGEAALKQVIATIDEVVRRRLSKTDQIEYVASCSFWHSLVGVGANGKPTTKVFSWADTRSRDHTATLKKRFDEPEVHNRTGARFHSSFWPAKLLWLGHDHPHQFERTSIWLSFSDFLALRLFGIATTSLSMASGTGMLDVRSFRWDAQLTRFLGLRPGQLPLVSTRPYTFSLNVKFAKRWPRLRNAQWFPAIGDGAANNIGAGCIKRSRAAIMIGTSGAMRVAYGGPPPDKMPPGLWCYRIDRDRVIVGGALSDGGGLYARVKKLLRLEMSDRSIADEISRRGADAHKLTVMPFFAGERSTGYNESAAGAVIGLQDTHDGIDLLQAVMESVAFRFAEILDQIKTVTSPREIVVSGGAIEASPVWQQILADVLGRDLAVFSESEASMRGAILLALESLGRIEGIQNVSTPTSRIKFHPKCHKIYKAARKRHQQHYDLLIKR